VGRAGAELAGEPPAGRNPLQPGPAALALPALRPPIGALQNMPVVSWLALRGRCRRCGVAIPLRYPLVELLTGVLAGSRPGTSASAAAALGALLLSSTLIALTSSTSTRSCCPTT
jgi:leader peptidase (prepilin peptidase) / N-methyltransferase